MVKMQKIIYVIFIISTFIYIHGIFMGFSWIAYTNWGALMVVTVTALNAISRLEQRISFLA